jgi:PAS domain S-box-containing protein
MKPPEDRSSSTGELLQNSGEPYRFLVESVKDYAIFMLDPTGHILTWNVGAERLKGYTAQEILGKHFSLFYPQDSIAAGAAEHDLEVAAVEGRFEDEGWRVRKDGTRFWANVIITALRDKEGRLIGFAKLTRDLTARRQADEQARQLVREQAARAEAEAASRRKDQFLAMLTHELRSPLAPVSTGLAVLREVGQDPRRREQTLEMMERQVRHLKRLLDDLLDVARIERGRVELRPERVDLARLIRTAVQDYRPVLERSGLKLDVQVPECPMWVWGDEARLVQVMANLLDNARKFTDPGGQVRVALEADPVLHEGVLTVRDTGIGIASDILPHIFESFSQADASLDRTRGGLGLGLSVVQGLVRLHGGRVAAASPGIGLGSVFTVRIPTQEEPPALADFLAAQPMPRTVRKVLVVEDSQDAANVLQILLEFLGHQVRVAYTGPEGVKIAIEWLPDVILSDIGLPGLDGYEVARRLRRVSGLEKALMVALTGYGGEEARRRSREAGFDHHLVKPADPADIQRLLVNVTEA